MWYSSTFMRLNWNANTGNVCTTQSDLSGYQTSESQGSCRPAPLLQAPRELLPGPHSRNCKLTSCHRKAASTSPIWSPLCHFRWSSLPFIPSVSLPFVVWLTSPCSPNVLRIIVTLRHMIICDADIKFLHVHSQDFCKLLLGRDGGLRTVMPPTASPLSAPVIELVEKFLAEPSPTDELWRGKNEEIHPAVGWLYSVLLIVNM